MNADIFNKSLENDRLKNKRDTLPQKLMNRELKHENIRNSLLL